MKCSLFTTVKSKTGIWCTYEQWLQYSSSPHVKAICDQIAQLPPDNHDAIGQLKKQLPVVTWQAYFDGQRLAAQAQPSGLCILDVDHVDDPFQLWNTIIPRRAELGILLAHKTPSCHGLRLVFECRPEFSTLDECQQWMAREIGVEHDPACKDWARASYMVPDNYVYFFDGALFLQEPTVVYEVKDDGRSRRQATDGKAAAPVAEAPQQSAQEGDTDLTFKEIPLKDIAAEWLRQNGGEPVEGERNNRIHKLAYDMRYITDFNEQTLLAALPSYGLPQSEMQTIIRSACAAPRSLNMPKRLQKVLDTLMPAPGDEDDDERILHVPDSPFHAPLPPLPPLIRQLTKVAPYDFKAPTVLSLLPLLGTLGSKLRARYLDRSLHSPSFQVSVEAPQASGKSFATRLASVILAPIIERDETVRQQEQEYDEKVAELKITGAKVTKKNRDELLGQRPQGIIRVVPPTISVTKLLKRMKRAEGLHLVAISEEIDTVTKTFKRAISSYSDALRVSFDNGNYGQDFASENSFSGIVKLYYNTLFCGTPKAMRRFYPDVEDGLVSRVLFVSIPDQFGKPMPVWEDLKPKDEAVVQEQIRRLDKICVDGAVVQPEHEMDLTFLNRALAAWLKEQQEEAVRTDDRTRDIFCRRAAVVGFRAGILAFFLYGERDTPAYRRYTVEFARWVANQMLTQHLLRFEIEGTGSNTNHWEDVYQLLPDEFGREDIQRICNSIGKSTPVKNIIYNWRLLDCVEITETVLASNGKHQAVRFRKKAGWSVAAAADQKSQ